MVFPGFRCALTNFCLALNVALVMSHDDSHRKKHQLSVRDLESRVQDVLKSTMSKGIHQTIEEFPEHIEKRRRHENVVVSHAHHRAKTKSILAVTRKFVSGMKKVDHLPETAATAGFNSVKIVESKRDGATDSYILYKHIASQLREAQRIAEKTDPTVLPILRQEKVLLRLLNRRSVLPEDARKLSQISAMLDKHIEQADESKRKIVNQNQNLASTPSAHKVVIDAPAAVSAPSVKVHAASTPATQKDELVAGQRLAEEIYARASAQVAAADAAISAGRADPRISPLLQQETAILHDLQRSPSLPSPTLLAALDRASELIRQAMLPAAPAYRTAPDARGDERARAVKGTDEQPQQPAALQNASTAPTAGA
eukprot:CAMPEP_0172163434 /NCGR_PEP_ID=MMETSP1050-20130122/7270_1 /TAXON_ID=233186 /ORGANISM="Cryptomonas curvata, Strain CCAP979/52" /LENGTH=369 /DNA_ID=CAMNT_0012833625 /DNA_START=52 /DNA_END=1157 /DNA_ORIENTATION=-